MDDRALGDRPLRDGAAWGVQRPERPTTGDPVGRQAPRALEPLQRRRRRSVEAPVDLRRGEAEATQAELERRDVPADATACELALSEERHAELPSLQRVAWPTFPVARIPLRRWNAITALRVIGPEMPSTAPV